MTAPPRPEDELARRAALRSFGILDTPPEQAFDDLARLAAAICGTPMAAVSLIDDERQWLKSAIGFEGRESPRELAFCAHAIAGDRPLMVVPDTLRDRRFADHPGVTGEPRLRFYAGAVVRESHGHALGTICVMDRRPREITPQQEDALEALARQAMALLDLRRQTAQSAHEAAARESAERHNAEREDLYRTVVAAMQEGILLLDGKGDIVACNTSAERILGRPGHDLVGTSALDPALALRHADGTLVTRDWHPLAAALATGTASTDVVLGVPTPAGDVRWIELDAQPLFEPGTTRLKGLVASFSDITARRRAEEAMLQSEDLTRSVIENMLGGLITIDTRGSIEIVNPAAEQLFGYKADELIGRPLSVLVPDTVGDKKAFLRDALPRAVGRVSEWEGLRKDGTVFPFELSMFAFETANGVRYAGSLRDISERRALDRMKDEFVATVSHELRTPLTSIAGSLSLMAAGVVGELPEEAAEMVDVARRNSARLLTLINDLLDLERTQTGRLDMHPAPAAAKDAIARAVEAVRGFAEEKRVKVDVEAAEGSMFADADRVVQVLVNLLSNAVKFSPPGRPVTVRAHETEDNVEFQVQDHGRGIPAAFVNSVFERFTQVHASDAREKGGTGLGLAICRAIVVQHGGHIGVESEEGRGSTFWFTIPRKGPGAEEARA
jgi:PAS domain S-box-containing protein